MPYIVHVIWNVPYNHPTVEIKIVGRGELDRSTNIIEVTLLCKEGPDVQRVVAIAEARRLAREYYETTLKNLMPPCEGNDAETQQYEDIMAVDRVMESNPPGHICKFGTIGYGELYPYSYLLDYIQTNEPDKILVNCPININGVLLA